MHTSRSTMLLLLFLAPAAAPAYATTGTPCARDAARLCADTEPGERRMAQCLKRHESALSPECRRYRETRREQIADASRTCRTDTATHCAGVLPGAGRVANCLAQHRNELSAPCRYELERLARP